MGYIGAALTRAGAVAVVEDDPSMRMALARLLRSMGLAVRPFASAEALLREDDVDGLGCLVVDVHLDGISGLVLQDLLRAAGRRIPFVLITGRDEAAAEEQARRDGSVLLRKPFDAELLREAVAAALGRERGREP
jgi:FixJ family two-component response regulator